MYILMILRLISLFFLPVTKSAGDASNNREKRQGHNIMYSQRRVSSTVTCGRVLVDKYITRRELGIGLVCVIFATYGGGGDSLASHCMSSIVVQGWTSRYLVICRAAGIFACTPCIRFKKLNVWPTGTSFYCKLPNTKEIITNFSRQWVETVFLAQTRFVSVDVSRRIWPTLNKHECKIIYKIHTYMCVVYIFPVPMAGRGDFAGFKQALRVRCETWCLTGEIVWIWCSTVCHTCRQCFRFPSSSETSSRMKKL